MRQHLNRSGGQPVLENDSGVHGRVVPVQEPFLLDHLRPLLPKMFQKLAQGCHGVVGVDGYIPKDNVRVHQPLTVKKHKHHLLGVARGHFGLTGRLLDPPF